MAHFPHTTGAYPIFIWATATLKALSATTRNVFNIPNDLWTGQVVSQWFEWEIIA